MSDNNFTKDEIGFLITGIVMQLRECKDAVMGLVQE